MKIGNDFLIGARVTILPGLTIENGCIIAAGVVVSKDCKPEGLFIGSLPRGYGFFDDDGIVTVRISYYTPITLALGKIIFIVLIGVSIVSWTHFS
ncbi:MULTISPECIES: DapH/DapD/GlmU-related protein [unclassified Peribacillus]|uniref:DapH/DapD/GlmU-related protein n=1 Tax=unclassified Peribacillus TaxID=2675266 RepID=UPI00366BC395